MQTSSQATQQVLQDGKENYSHKNAVALFMHHLSDCDFIKQSETLYAVKEKRIIDKLDEVVSTPSTTDQVNPW